MAKRLDTSAHGRLGAALLEDGEYREEYEQSRREIEAIDRVIGTLDALRERSGLSKAELARMVNRNPSSIRRLFTQKSNPELAARRFDRRRARRRPRGRGRQETRGQHAHEAARARRCVRGDNAFSSSPEH